MIDQLIIGDKASYDDFEASVKERVIKDGAKKEIKETVPFSNVTYDFSGINGEVYWGEKELKYVLELTADTAEELEEKKIDLKTWLMNVAREELHDPYIRDYHFNATFKSIDVDDSEIEKSTITVIFTAYPYMIANTKRVHVVELAGNEEVTINVQNDSSHPITPTFVSDVAFTVKHNNSSYGIPSGETTDASFKLAAGANTLTLQATGSGTVTIFFHEEVF